MEQATMEVRPVTEDIPAGSESRNDQNVENAGSVDMENGTVKDYTKIANDDNGSEGQHKSGHTGFSFDAILESVLTRYIDFVAKYAPYICCLWVVIFIICIIYGPQFLTKTRSNLDLPKGSPSIKAINTFEDNYPDVSTWPPAFIVSHSTSDDINVIGSFTKTLSEELSAFATDHSSVIMSVTGYWELIGNPSTEILALQSVSDNNRTLIETVYFNKDTNVDEINNVIDDLLVFAKDQDSADISVRCTGLFALFEEMSVATATNFEMIDATVLPIAIVILGTQVKSYRHMGVALCNLICTLLLAFAVLLPITAKVAINPFAPSIMMSLGIAICFDYSLFLLTRFQEEMTLGNRSTKEAVLASILASGHVVILSGCTLFFTFALLIAFPQNFLKSVGWGCGAIVLTAMICNLSITPALLLTFRCLSRFEMFPSRNSCCCYIKDDVPVDDSNDQPDGAQPSSTEVVTAQPANDVESSPSAEIRKIQPMEMEGKPGYQAVAAVDGNMNKVSEPTTKSWFGRASQSLNDLIFPEELAKSNRSIYFKIAFITTLHPYALMLVILGVTAPFFYRFLTMKPTSDDTLIYLRGSSSLQGLDEMKNDFPVGRMDPYSIVMTTGGVSGGVMTQTYFDIEQFVIQELFDKFDGKYIDSDSISALSFFNGEYVSWNTSMAYMNSSSALYNTKIAGAYRTVVGGLPNSAQSASLIHVETIINPNSEGIVGFIRKTRSFLDHDVSTIERNGLNIEAYLFGGYTTTLDVQEALYKIVPYMIVATLAVVLLIIAASFGSLFTAIRLLVTVFISLCWTYGLMVMVYQPGEAQKAFAVLTPYLTQSSGIYWIIPVMSFSILVGLALDYDIFLITRTVEFRRMGWSDRACICLAIEKTAVIITAAGVIMSISFAGLLIPKSTVLNQYGFSLFIGVLFDTFLIRVVIVPVIFTLLDFSWIYDQMNWWPTRMPDLVLTPEEEKQALLGGFWSPQEYLEYKKSL